MSPASTAGAEQQGMQKPCSSFNYSLITNPKERTADESRSGANPVPTPHEGEAEE